MPELNSPEIIKLDSKCADGDPCWLIRQHEGCSMVVRLGAQEICVFDEAAPSEMAFIHKIKESDHKCKVTSELERELRSLYRRFRSSEREEIHELLDYDS